MALVIPNKNQYKEDWEQFHYDKKITLEEMIARYGKGTRFEFFQKYTEIAKALDAKSRDMTDKAFHAMSDIMVEREEEEDREDDVHRAEALAKAAVAEARARQNAKTLKQKADALAQTQMGHEGFVQAVKDVFATRPPLIYTPPTPQPRIGEKLTAVLLLSDLHSGAIHDIRKMGGLGNFNQDLFAQRMERVTQGVLRVVQQLRATDTVNRLIICWGGDNIEGRNIFAGQVLESAPMVHQFTTALEVASGLLVAPLAAAFETVKMYAVPGNHGRVGKKDEGLDRVEDSMDITWIEVLRSRCKNLTNVVWNTDYKDWAAFDLYGYTFFLHHGDKNKGPAHTPTVGARNRRRDLEAVINRKIDVYLSGHLHSAGLSMDGYSYQITNGAVPGTGPYAVSLGYASPPIQTLITVSRDCPVQSHHPLQLASRAECLTFQIEPDDEEEVA